MMQARHSASVMVVERLRPEDVRTVFPLMREAAPTITLPHWLRYAQRLSTGPARGRSGILVARRGGLKFPCGAVCYRQDRDVAHGRALTAEHMIALDLIDPEVVVSALLAELDRIAGAFGCTTIRSIVHGRRSGLARELQSAGHEVEGLTLIKAVTSGTLPSPPR